MSFFKSRVRKGMESLEYAQAYAEAKAEVVAEADEMEGFDSGFVLLSASFVVLGDSVMIFRASEPIAPDFSSSPVIAALPVLQAAEGAGATDLATA